MNFRILILGSNSAIPAFGRNPSAQYIQHFGESYLVDCGEGTQIRMSAFKVKRSRLKAIFISHLHGDHVFGLPGLLTTLSLSGFEEPIQLIGPMGISEFILHNLKFSESQLRFSLNILEVSHTVPQIVYESERLKVSSFPLTHRVPTVGYRFSEKIKRPRLRADLVKDLGLNTQEIKDILSGKDFQGTIHKQNSDFFTDAPPSYSYAYCSDTLYDPAIIPYIQGVDLLYHEATFEEKLKSMALERYHSTAKQAAQMALLAGAKKLLIGHFSSRYQDLTGLLEEAREVFPDTELAEEGKWFFVGQQNWV